MSAAWRPREPHGLYLTTPDGQTRLLGLVAMLARSEGAEPLEIELENGRTVRMVRELPAREGRPTEVIVRGKAGWRLLGMRRVNAACGSGIDQLLMALGFVGRTTIGMALALLLIAGCASSADEVIEEPAPTTGYHDSLVSWGTTCSAWAHRTCYSLTECSIDPEKHDAVGDFRFDEALVAPCESALVAECCVGHDCTGVGCYGADCPGANGHTTGEVVACVLTVAEQKCADVEAGTLPAVCEWISPARP